MDFVKQHNGQLEDLTFYENVGKHSTRIFLDSGSQISIFRARRFVTNNRLHTTECTPILIAGFQDSPVHVRCDRSVLTHVGISKKYQELMELLITDQREDVILKKPWFEKYNPVVQWTTNEVRFQFKGEEIVWICRLLVKERNDFLLSSKEIRRIIKKDQNVGILLLRQL